MKKYTELIEDQIDLKNEELKRLRESGNIKEIIDYYKKEIEEIIKISDISSIDNFIINERSCKRNYRKRDYIKLDTQSNLKTKIKNICNNLRYESREILDTLNIDNFIACSIYTLVYIYELNRTINIRGYPQFLRNTSFHYKLYKRLLIEYGYITILQDIYNNEICNMLSNDIDLYSFKHKNTILYFNRNYGYDKIIEILKILDDDIIYDLNFLIKYELENDELEKIIKE